MLDRKKYFNRLKNLPQYQNLSEEELYIIVDEKLQEESILGSLTFAVNDEEKEYAKSLLNRYFSQSSIEQESDKELLKQLIDQHLLAERFKTIMKIDYNKANPAQSVALVDQLDKIVDRIINLQEKLGLSNKDREQDSWKQYWQKLEKKCLNYYKDHAGETYTKCPKCQHSYRLLMRVGDKEKVSATFFKGTKIYNKKLFSLYHEKRLTQEELSEILGVSIQYIDVIYNELFLAERKND